jgi:hypothetical protein
MLNYSCENYTTNRSDKKNTKSPELKLVRSVVRISLLYILGENTEIRIQIDIYILIDEIEN